MANSNSFCFSWFILLRTWIVSPRTAVPRKIADGTVDPAWNLLWFGGAGDQCSIQKRAAYRRIEPERKRDRETEWLFWPGC